MKVLVVSNFFDNSGWSFAAQNYVLAMDAANIDVVIRNIKLNNIKGEVHPRILELEKKSDKNCDIVIQKVLPHMMSYNGNFKKNIGLFVCETNHFRNSNWASYLNIMDANIVPSQSCKMAYENSGCIKPVSVIPEPYNQAVFDIGYEPLDLNLPEDSFNFYFIGENIKRKNLKTLLQAFHLAFAPYEPVNLVIKTHMSGVPENQQEQKIQEFIKQTKFELKLYHNLNKYKGEIVLLGNFSNLDIMRLHATCHCYVAPSYGEGWNIPAFNALAFGNPVLATQGTGMDDYLLKKFLVKSTKYPAVENVDTFEELCAGDETWNQIDIYALIEQMRDVYENYKEYKDVALNTNLDRFTYGSVGQEIKKVLEQ